MSVHPRESGTFAMISEDTPKLRLGDSVKFTANQI